MSDRISSKNRPIMRKMENLVSKFIRPLHQVRPTSPPPQKKQKKKAIMTPFIQQKIY